MSSPKAAPGAAASNAAASLAALLSPARAEASRKNGAKSRGPKTPEGKARASKNALKHGSRAEKHVVVEGECPKTFAAFEAALVDDLAPEGALQSLLAGRIVRAAWRLERAERIEAELFAREMQGLFDDGDLGLALISDGNGARAFDVLLRYRGAAQAELFRALRMLKALQAEAAPGRRARATLEAAPEQALLGALPNQPKARANAGGSCGELGSRAPGPVGERGPNPFPTLAPEAAAPGPVRPASIEPALAAMPRAAAPSAPRQGAKSEPCLPSRTGAPGGSASLLAGTALTSFGRPGGV
jgi:hypothetical protein